MLIMQLAVMVFLAAVAGLVVWATFKRATEAQAEDRKVGDREHELDLDDPRYWH